MVLKQLEKIKCLVSELDLNNPITYYVQQELSIVIDMIHTELEAQAGIKLLKMQEGKINDRSVF